LEKKEAPLSNRDKTIMHRVAKAFPTYHCFCTGTRNTQEKKIAGALERPKVPLRLKSQKRFRVTYIPHKTGYICGGISQSGGTLFWQLCTPAYPLLASTRFYRIFLYIFATPKCFLFFQSRVYNIVQLGPDLAARKKITKKTTHPRPVENKTTFGIFASFPSGSIVQLLGVILQHRSGGGEQKTLLSLLLFFFLRQQSLLFGRTCKIPHLRCNAVREDAPKSPGKHGGGLAYTIRMEHERFGAAAERGNIVQTY
jgi:hypothetical protein